MPPRRRRAPRRSTTDTLKQWWQQTDPPWWARFALIGVAYTGYLLLDSRSFDADEYRKIVALLVVNLLGMKK